MTPRLTTDYAKNYCNRTLIVKVILENVVTCFLLGHSVQFTDPPVTLMHLLSAHVTWQMVSANISRASASQRMK